MVGLFPFPRVGRSDPDLIQEWDGSDFSLNSNEDYGGDELNNNLNCKKK